MEAWWQRLVGENQGRQWERIRWHGWLVVRVLGLQRS